MVGFPKDSVISRVGLFMLVKRLGSQLRGAKRFGAYLQVACITFTRDRINIILSPNAKIKGLKLGHGRRLI